MARKKGSKNKVKIKFAASNVDKITPFIGGKDSYGVVDKPVETVDKQEDKTIVPCGTFCKECQHHERMHYGGLKGHCNTKDCACLEHKA